MFIFLILNILDCVTTYIGIQSGLTEGNLLLSYLFDLNIYFGLLVKMLLAVVVVLLLNLLKKQNLYKALNIAFSAIVIWNALWIILGV